MPCKLIVSWWNTNTITQKSVKHDPHHAKKTSFNLKLLLPSLFPHIHSKTTDDNKIGQEQDILFRTKSFGQWMPHLSTHVNGIKRIYAKSFSMKWPSTLSVLFYQQQQQIHQSNMYSFSQWTGTQSTIGRKFSDDVQLVRHSAKLLPKKSREKSVVILNDRSIHVAKRER